MNKCYLYCLIDPGCRQPFYVGATNDPKLREAVHRRRFLSLFSFVILETLENPQEMAVIEAELINWYLDRGVKLKNVRTDENYRGPRVTSGAEEETIKVQVEISKTLADALSTAANNDHRSRPLFIIKTLEETPAVKAALKTIQNP